MLNKDQIISLLQKNDRAVARALVVLNDRQTSDEQNSEHTRYHNGQGFRPCHARMGSSMAKFYARNGYLTPKQIAYWRQLDKSGSMRIGIYWRQLAEAAEAKKAVPEVIARDLGNDMERKIVLEEMIDTTQDQAELKPMQDELAEIDAFWARIRGNNNA